IMPRIKFLAHHAGFCVARVEEAKSRINEFDTGPMVVPPSLRGRVPEQPPQGSLTASMRARLAAPFLDLLRSEDLKPLRLPRELIKNLEAAGDFKEAVEVSREEWVPYLEKTWGAEVKDCYRAGVNLTLVLMEVWNFEGIYPPEFDPPMKVLEVVRA